MRIAKRTLLCSVASVALSSVTAPVLAQSCSTYPMTPGTKLERTGPGVMKISFTQTSPLRADSTTVRGIAWRRAKARATEELTRFIQVDLATKCTGGEEAGETATFTEGQEIFSAQDSFKEVCDYATAAKVQGVRGLIEAGRCATPVSEGGEVRVTVGVSTGTMASAGLIQRGANPNPVSTVEQENPANRNTLTPAPTGYSGYSDDW